MRAGSVGGALAGGSRPLHAGVGKTGGGREGCGYGPRWAAARAKKEEEEGRGWAGSGSGPKGWGGRKRKRKVFSIFCFCKLAQIQTKFEFKPPNTSPALKQKLCISMYATKMFL